MSTIVAWDNEGNFCDGKLTIGSASVEIYKNWVYVRNSRMWKKEYGYTNNVIAQVEHGNVMISGFDIHTARYKEQGAVFCFVDNTKCKYGKVGECLDVKHRYMAGIGCSGFKSQKQWLQDAHPKIFAKIDKKYWNEKRYSLTTVSSGNRWWYEFTGSKENKVVKMDGIAEPTSGELWVGVTGETLHSFFKWLKSVAPKEYADKVITEGF